MTNYIIVTCSKCRGYLLAKASQKSRTCPYCGSRVLLEKARRVASAEKADAALMMLRKLKERTAKHGKARLQRPF
ncbi:MAG: DUF1922 domain-containing protein [Candidatus Bathyarchaeia archaeon]